MLFLTLAVLTIAAGIGAFLAVQLMRGAAPPAHWPARLAHALVGVAGMTPLVIVVRQGEASNRTGTEGFAAYSAALFGVALFLGLIVAIFAWRRRPPGWLVGAHASLAIAGYVLLLALVTR